MADPLQIQSFLNDFKGKLSVWDVVFRDDRGKNAQTLLHLEITPAARKRIIEELEIKDYSQGPIEDALNKSTPMWVFGKKIKGQEVYIKITMGIVGASVICISFHIAEFAMKYPLKN